MNYKNPLLQQLIESGIPVLSAHFHNAVNNGDNTPENSFALDSNNKSRRVEMWATKADLLVCKHKEKLFFTPMANVKFGFFKENYTYEESKLPKEVVPLITSMVNNQLQEEANYAPPAKKRGRPFKNPQQNS